MLAYGKLSRELMAGGYSQGRLGFEFAGTLPAGGAGPPAAPPRRVMGVARQAIATSVGAPQYLVSAQEWQCTVVAGRPWVHEAQLESVCKPSFGNQELTEMAVRHSTGTSAAPLVTHL